MVGAGAGPAPRSSLVDVSQWIMVALQVTVRPISTAGPGRSLAGRQDKARDAEPTINGADGEAEPPVLVSVQGEEDDQVGDGRQDDSRGAQSGSAHEKLACRDRVAQTGDLAEGQSQCDAMHGVTEISDLDQTCAPQYKDKGEGEVDHDVVGKKWDRDG